MAWWTRAPIPYVVVFIPALNEADSIAEAIRQTKHLYRDPAAHGFRIDVVVVDDGSTDRTAEAARAAGAERVVSHTRNMGLGAATRTGIQTAFEMGADVAVKLDADLQHDPADVARVVEPILAGRAEIVWGSRWTGRITYRMPFHRRVGNVVFTRLMRFLTDYPITDAQTGLMAYGRRYMAEARILSNYNPPQQILIDAHAKGMRYAEVPVVFRPRTTGRSFVSFRYPFKVLPAILRMLVHANPLRVFVPLGLAMWVVGAGFAALDIYEHLVLGSPGFIRHIGTVVLCGIGGLQVLAYGLLADLVIRR